jgi:hypothetical protein
MIHGAIRMVNEAVDNKRNGPYIYVFFPLISVAGKYDIDNPVGYFV